MKNEIILKIIIFLFAMIGIYFLFAFFKWELNPANWSEEERLLSIIIYVVVVFSVITFPMKLINKN